MVKRFFLGLVTALFLCMSAAAFSDVPAGHWAAGDIARCAEAGYITGQSAHIFGLGSPMTRSGFVAALDRFFDWEEATLTAPFTDVPAEAWYADAVNAAWEQGALSTWETTFRPNDPITREEMAVLLVRALGFGEIAGLAQDTALPFTDAAANRGYLALCRDFSLLSGTSETTFSPDAPATREQAAAVLMRLHDRLATKPKTVAVTEEWSDALTGYDTVVLTGGKLLRTKVTSFSAAPDTAVPVLLGISAKASVLGGKPAVMSQALAQAVEDGGYDGLYLDIGTVSEKYRSALSALASAAASALGEKPFYLVAEGAVLTGKSYGGYDYAALAAAADTLVLRPHQMVESLRGFTTAPVNASEECWNALHHAGAKNAALLLSDGAHAWKDGRETEVFPLTETPEGALYSQRYDCSYWLSGKETVWYLGEAGTNQRRTLSALMGCSTVVTELAV